MADEQDQDAGDPERWGELAGRLEGVLGAEQHGAPEGGFPGGPVAPQGLPVLDRIASIADRLEAQISQDPGPDYARAGGPQRPEDVLPSPTTLAGLPNPSSAWHGGQPWGIDPSEPPPVIDPAEPPPYQGADFPEFSPPPTVELPAFPTPQSARGEQAAAADFPLPAPPPYGDAPGFPEFAPPGGVDRPAPDFGPPPAPYADRPGFAELAAPPPPAYGQLPGGSAPSAGGDDFGQGAGAPAGGEYRLPEFPDMPAPDYPRLPMGGDEAPQSQAGGAAGPHQEGGLASVLSELRDAIQGLKAGRQEKAPGPQPGGSFVPGGPGMIGSMFGAFPSGYRRHGAGGGNDD